MNFQLSFPTISPDFTLQDFEAQNTTIERKGGK
jgi:hypothetical protein